MISLHERLAQSLINEIASGFYWEGRRFLSTRIICVRWHVSLKTAKSALKNLVRLGLIKPKDRSGYYLTPYCRHHAEALLKLSPKLLLTPPVNWRDRRFQRFVWRQSNENPKTLHFGIIISGILDKDIKGVEIDDSHPYLNRSPSFRVMSQFASEQGIQTCFLRDDGSAAQREYLKKRIVDLKLDGIIAMRRLPTHAPMDEVITDFVQSGMPVITLFGDCEHLDVRAIDLNNVKCGKTVIERFARLGHRQIAVIMPKIHNPWFDDFCVGARLAQKSQIGAKISIHKVRMPLDGNLPASEQRLFNSDNPNRITACLVTASRLMPGLLRYCDMQKYIIPDDLSVVLTADIIYLQELKRHFDLMRINFKDLGKMAMRSLLSMCNAEQIPRIQLIDLKFQNNGTSTNPPSIRKG